MRCEVRPSLPQHHPLFWIGTPFLLTVLRLDCGMIETLAQREDKIRESWVRTMEARIVREELQKCHKAEGVNHYQACADLAKKYHSLLADAKVT